MFKTAFCNLGLAIEVMKSNSEIRGGGRRLVHAIVSPYEARLRTPHPIEDQPESSY
jgi:hypothetical protein